MKSSDPRIAAAVWQSENYLVFLRLVTLAIGLIGAGIACLYLYLFP
jgi:hypothetical protein